MNAMSLNVCGLVAGMLLGFLMQRARVIRYDRQINALRLKDMTIVKFMLAAVMVGMVGLYLLQGAGAVKFSIKATVLGGTIIGGLVFGAGWGLLGYCPATSLAALGEGRWDAVFGILGMLVGAGLFAEVYPFLKKTLLAWGDYGKITLPQVLHGNPWLVIILFWVLAALLFVWFENRKL